MLTSAFTARRILTQHRRVTEMQTTDIGPRHSPTLFEYALQIKESTKVPVSRMHSCSLPVRSKGF